MPNIRQISARQLSVAALALWCCSLALTGLVIYGKQRHLYGLEILATGWLSPLVGNFAWFANIFFLHGISRLLSGEVPRKSAMLAAFLSLDTFRLSRFPLDEGGGTSPVYGYGWGAVLWFASIFLMLVATGTRQRETDTPENPSDLLLDPLRPLGFVFLSITLAGAFFFAIRDRAIANPAETQRLAKIAFKRGKVCGAPEPVVINPILNLSGPIELVMGENILHATYPFAQIDDLLGWGIPTIRVGNADYSRESTANDTLISSIPAAGEPAAILYVNEYSYATISAKLIESHTNRTVFEQTWKIDNSISSAYWCPDYNSFPRFNEQPRQLLMQALNIPATTAATREGDRKTIIPDTIEGNIVERSSGSDPHAMEIIQSNELSNREQMMTPNEKIRTSLHERFNTNCASDIGWEATGSNNRSWQGGKLPFMVKGKAYYLRHRNHARATCEDEFAYIYSGIAAREKYYLNIEKRDLRDFRQAWAKIIVISDMNLFTRDNILKVRSIKKTGDAATTLELVHEDSGQILFVQAPLPDD